MPYKLQNIETAHNKLIFTIKLPSYINMIVKSNKIFYATL